MQVERNRIGTFPLWLSDLKGHLQIDTNDHDTLLNTLLSSAIETVEKYCNISLVETKVKVFYEVISWAELLPYGPVRSVEESAGLEVVGLLPGYAKVKGEAKNVTIEYTAGMTAIPDPIKLAVMKLATDNFEQRAGFSMSGRLTLMRFPNDWRASLAPYRKVSYIT